MENLTHSLTGYALARAGLDRFSPHAGILLLLAANAPDLDIVFLAQGRLQYFEAHRGYSHSLLFLPVMALLSVLVTAAIFRQRLPWLRAWLIACVGVASHLLLDWTNNYGIRLGLPFSPRWFHSDLNGLFDVWILLALLFAAIWPFFSRLVSNEIGSRARPRRGPATFALFFFCAFDCARAFLHSQALSQLDARIYDSGETIQTAAFPNPYSPLDWVGAVETTRVFLKIPVRSFGNLNLNDAKSYFKPEITPALRRAKDLEEFRFLRYFSRFPVWSLAPVSTPRGEATRIDLTDLRFGEPGAGAFHSLALVGPDNRVLHSWFTYGSGQELGWGADGN